MNELRYLLPIAIVSALQLVVLPTFVVLVAVSLGYRARTGRWLPLWKLGLVLLASALLGIIGFALHWGEELAPGGHDVGQLQRPATQSPA